MQPTDVRTIKIVRNVIIGFVAFILLLTCFGTVEAGSRGIKTRFNAVVDTLEPGLYFKLPYPMEKVRDMDVRTQTVNYDSTSTGVGALAAASRDLQDVAVSVTANYHVDPVQAAEIFKQYRSTESYGENIVEPLVRDSVKTAASSYTAEELITKRAEFNDKATVLLEERLKGKLVILERVNITNIQFSDSFTQAIEAKVTAEQEALAVKNQLEKTKYQAEQQVVQAQGQADSTKIVAEAEAEAIRLKADAIISQGGEEYVRLKAIEKWKGDVPSHMIPNATVPFIDLK